MVECVCSRLESRGQASDAARDRRPASSSRTREAAWLGSARLCLSCTWLVLVRSTHHSRCRARLTEKAVQGSFIRKSQVQDRFRVADKPLHVLRRELVALLVAGRRQRPSRRPDKDLGALDDGPDGGQDLDTGCARAYQDDVLVVERDALVPVGAVQLGALEALEPGDVGPCWLVQVACCVDQDMAPVVHDLAGPEVGDGDVPLALDLVPGGLGDEMRSVDVLPQVVLCGKILKVALDLARAGKDRREVGLGLEGVRVVVRGDITGTSGIAVFIPRPSNLGILVIDLACSKLAI